MPTGPEHFPVLQNNEKVPHVGWNKVYAPKGVSWHNTIFDVKKNDLLNFYFVHSYILMPDKKENIFGLTTYGGKEFCSIVKKGNIYGCQFHPERSGEIGLGIIKNFIKTLR